MAREDDFEIVMMSSGVYEGQFQKTHISSMDFNDFIMVFHEVGIIFMSVWG